VFEEVLLFSSVSLLAVGHDFGIAVMALADCGRIEHRQGVGGHIEMCACFVPTDDEFLARIAVAGPRDFQRERLAVGTPDERCRGVLDVEAIGSLIEAPHIQVGVVVFLAKLRSRRGRDFLDVREAHEVESDVDCVGTDVDDSAATGDRFPGEPAAAAGDPASANVVCFDVGNGAQFAVFPVLVEDLNRCAKTVVEPDHTEGIAVGGHVCDSLGALQ